LLEVSTDKVDTEIPSPVAGVLQEILVSEDETVAVGTALARIGDGSGGGDGAQSPAQESAGQESAGQESAGQESPAQEAPAQEAQPETEPAADQVQAEATVPTPDVDAPPVRPSSTEVEQPAERPRPTAEPGGDGQRVQMPALGESVTEGTVTRWLKHEGDTVEVDEPLLEVSTDKVDTEIPSPVAGVVRQILVSEDETVAVGADLVVVGPSGGEPSAPAEQQPQQQAPPAPPAPRPAPSAAPPPPPPAPAAPPPAAPASPPAAPAAPAPAPAPAAASSTDGSAPMQDGSSYAEYPATNPAPAPSGQQSPAQAQSSQALRSPEAPGQHAMGGQLDPSAYVTPLVRRLAAEHDVDLSGITGTGVGGRVRKQDVLEAAKAKQAAAEQAARQAAQPAQAQPEPAAAAPSAAPGQPAPDHSALRGTTVKMSRLRKVIAQRMVESLQVSAQLTTVVEVDVTRIARLRERAKRDFQAREGVRLSFLPFFAVAAVEALKQYPVVNASIEDDQIVYHAEAHLGIAVDTDRGLLVPVIKSAGDLNIAGIARKITDLAERTRSNKITPDDLGGGTFTLTNTGSRGALFDTPIINQPQVGILGTGAVVKRPVVVTDADGEETIAVRSMVYLALTYDHRIVDGADAARFLVAVKHRLEEGAFEADLGL
jgi:2-oxoglutarate dehydrogenase E2 component (dihydrolipoamide succinyltransferase)